jgi:hypothetical protein
MALGSPHPDSVATPYELWCERQHVRPDDPGVFDVYLALEASALVAG